MPSIGSDPILSELSLSSAKFELPASRLPPDALLIRSRFVIIPLLSVIEGLDLTVPFEQNYCGSVFEHLVNGLGCMNR